MSKLTIHLSTCQLIEAFQVIRFVACYAGALWARRAIFGDGGKRILFNRGHSTSYLTGILRLGNNLLARF